MEVTAGLLLRGAGFEHSRKKLSLQQQRKLQVDLEKISTPDLNQRSGKEGHLWAGAMTLADRIFVIN